MRILIIIAAVVLFQGCVGEGPTSGPEDTTYYVYMVLEYSVVLMGECNRYPRDIGDIGHIRLKCGGSYIRIPRKQKYIITEHYIDRN